MVVGFTTTYAISAYHHWVRISIRARCTSLCDKVCQWLATGRWFSLGTPVSSTNNTDRHDITEILFKMALNTINQSINHICTLKLLQMHIKNIKIMYGYLANCSMWLGEMFMAPSCSERIETIFLRNDLQVVCKWSPVSLLIKQKPLPIINCNLFMGDNSEK